MTKEEANKVISEKRKEIYANVKECQKLADEHGLEFSINIAYGMGGTYVSAKALKAEYDEDEYDDSWFKENSGWNSSSHQC